MAGDSQARISVCYVNPAGGALLDSATAPAAHVSFGGAEVALLAEARLLAREPGFGVSMIVHGGPPGRFRHDDILVHRIADTYHDQPLPGYVAYRQAFWSALRDVDADVYIQRGVPADLYFLAAAFCRLHGKKYVQVLALAPAVPSSSMGLKAYVRWVVLEQASLRLASAVVALSREQVASLSPSVQAKTRVIYEGKALPAVTPALAQRSFVLWAGRHAPEKRIEVVLELARTLPDQPFVLAVVGPFDLAVPANVTVMRNVAPQAMGPLYAGAKLVVHTSRSEGFSNVFIEAWAHGTPVVSFGVDCDGMIARHGLGRCAPSQPALAREVAALLADAKAWTVCSENARHHARVHHDAERQLQRYLRLFRALAPPRRRPSAPEGAPKGAQSPGARLLLVSTARGAGSGAERVLAEMLRGWPDAAGVFAVLAPRESGVARVAHERGIPTVSLDGPDTLLGNWHAVHRALDRIPASDLVHAWTAQSFELAAYVAGRRGIPHTATLHDHPAAPFLNPARRGLMRVGTARAAGVVCVSEALRGACAQAGYQAPLAVIRNGLPRAATTAASSPRVRIGFLGMAFGHKGFTVVRDWAGRLAGRPGVEWHLYGGVRPSVASELETLRTLLPGRLTIHGHCPAEQIFRNLDVVVHPSLTFDPFPTVLLEAARAGLPAVASDVGGTAEIVRHGDTGFLFDVGRPEDGLAALVRLLDDAALRTAMGQAAGARFNTDFTIDKMVAGYRAFWEQRR